MTICHKCFFSWIIDYTNTYYYPQNKKACFQAFRVDFLNIHVLHVLAAVCGDKFLSGGEVVSEKSIEHLLGKCRVGWSHRNKSACCGVHGGLPHHVGLILTKSLGTLKCVFFAFYLLEYFCFLKLILREEYLILVLLALYCYLKQRRFGNKDLVLLEKSGEQTVEKRKKKGSYLESVLVSIGTDNYL